MCGTEKGNPDFEFREEVLDLKLGMTEDEIEFRLAPGAPPRRSLPRRQRRKKTSMGFCAEAYSALR